MPSIFLMHKSKGLFLKCDYRANLEYLKLKRQLNFKALACLVVYFGHRYMGQNFERCTIGSRHGVKLKFQKC